MNKNQSEGGTARARSLSKEERSLIARKAAESRWNPDILEAKYTGAIHLGEIDVPCAVLSNGKRVVVQREVVYLLTGTRKGGLDRYLTASNLAEYVPSKFKGKRLSESAIVFRMNGKLAHGFEGDDLVDICRMYLDARKAGALSPQQSQLAHKAEMIISAFAKVGITALIDEATGYQEVRAKDALQKYLEMVLRKELAVWAKTFPDDYYEQMFRLKKWTWLSASSSKRPQVVAKYTKDIVYERLGPGILDALEEKNPILPQGYRKAKHHQWLSEDAGNPMLKQHLISLIALMKAARTWDEFYRSLNRAFPKQGSQLEIEFDET